MIQGQPIDRTQVAQLIAENEALRKRVRQLEQGLLTSLMIDSGEKARAERAEQRVQELDELYQSCFKQLGACETALERAEAELAAAREDAERLNWMQHNGASVHWTQDSEYCCVVWSDREDEYRTKPFSDWRAAIDAARGPG